MDADIGKSFCFACGRRIDGDIRFCGYCGTSTLAIGYHKVLRYDGVYVTKPQVEHGISAATTSGSTRTSSFAGSASATVTTPG